MFFHWDELYRQIRVQPLSVLYFLVRLLRDLFVDMVRYFFVYVVVISDSFIYGRLLSTQRRPRAGGHEGREGRLDFIIDVTL